MTTISVSSTTATIAGAHANAIGRRTPARYVLHGIATASHRVEASSHAVDFGARPPEINSARLFAGPGSEPMLGAAAVWDRLADEWYSTAVSYRSTVSSLTGQGWLGPASASMAAATNAHVRWMTATAELCGNAGARARAAAAAYEAAAWMAVPPTVIAANRSQLSSLIAANALGQNAPAIAAIEAGYGEMWARDASAMYRYADESAVASRLSPFVPLPMVTGAAASARQTAGSTQTAGLNARMTLSQLTSTLPEALDALATPTSYASGLAQLVRRYGGTAISPIAAASALSSPARWSDTDVSPRRAMSLGALSVPKTWVRAARGC
jgi:PPE-repeat protein